MVLGTLVFGELSKSWYRTIVVWFEFWVFLMLEVLCELSPDVSQLK